MKKNIGKFKQWANEKVGAGQKTQLTDEFQELQQKTEERHNGIDKLHAATKNYLKTMSKKTESEEKTKTLPIEALGSTIRNYGEDIGVESSYGNYNIPQTFLTVIEGSALVKFGTANEKIANLQLEFVSRVREEFLEGTESTIAELKQYQQLKRKLESRRLDYDAKLNRVQKSKKEKPELEEELRASKEKYDDTMEELHSKMQFINDSEDQYIQELTSFLDAQLEYYKKSYEILSGIRNDWVEGSSSTKPTRRTLIRKKTTDSQNSDDVEERHSDSESVLSSYNRSKKSRPTPKRTSSSTNISKSEDSYNTTLNIPSSSRKKQGSSAKSSDVGKTLNARKAATSQPATKKQVRAIYSYEGDGDDELAIEEGEIITVLEEHEGWWIGEIVDPDGSKRSGMFPANYTEEIKVEPTRASRASLREEEEEEEDSIRGDSDQYEDEESYGETVRTRTPPPTSRSAPTRQTSRLSQVANPSGSPPVPSRNSKPPPVRKATTRVRASSPTNVGGRNSYISQELIEKSATSSHDVGPCKECDCEDYSPN
ncbi:9483_t:CDS:2 [Acaulospora colombiana]|uniref:9483_t:CDS:1 n=1 Tax=Acaulospora colombiana TaxID=27376 RepID=A0ACA9KPB4_9GLOM|nr:9483_t:CDS:2 [Acaulospora colombiana]